MPLFFSKHQTIHSLLQIFPLFTIYSYPVNSISFHRVDHHQLPADELCRIDQLPPSSTKHRIRDRCFLTWTRSLLFHILRSLHLFHNYSKAIHSHCTTTYLITNTGNTTYRLPNISSHFPLSHVKKKREVQVV